MNNRQQEKEDDVTKMQRPAADLDQQKNVVHTNAGPTTLCAVLHTAQQGDIVKA
jgi:hypothetical protein